MAQCEKYRGSGLTMKDIRDFVEQSDDVASFIPDNTEVFISQHEEGTLSPVKHIIGDKESVNIYDWI